MRKRRVIKIITLILAFIGLLVVIVGVHEFTHVAEMIIKDAEVTEICLMNILSDSIGYVKYSYHGEELSLSEPMAYVTMLMIGLVLEWVILMHFFPFKDKKK